MSIQIGCQKVIHGEMCYTREENIVENSVPLYCWFCTGFPRLKKYLLFNGVY